MPDSQKRSVEPFLDEAQATLEQALDEACEADLKSADTGELIRIEEALHAASLAAKEVVSLRLRRRTEREAGGPPEPEAATARSARDDNTRTDKTRNDNTEEHRVIVDESGVPWLVVAVYPSSRSVDKGTLPDKFAGGWLLFQHGDDARRHAPVPDNWRALADDDLRRLCRGADVATRRITTIQSPEEKLRPKPSPQ